MIFGSHIDTTDHRNWNNFAHKMNACHALPFYQITNGANGREMIQLNP